MAAVTTILAIASLVIAAGSAYVSYKQNQQAAREQRKARTVSMAENAAKQQQDIRQQVRQERVKRAQIIQASQNTGVSMSSGSLGGQGALSTQIGGNIGQISRESNSNQAISQFGQAAADASGRAATFAQVSGLAASSFQMFADTPSAKSDFKKMFS